MKETKECAIEGDKFYFNGRLFQTAYADMPPTPLHVMPHAGYPFLWQAPQLHPYAYSNIPPYPASYFQPSAQDPAAYSYYV